MTNEVISIARWSIGRATDSDSVQTGSTPVRAASLCERPGRTRDQSAKLEQAGSTPALASSLRSLGKLRLGKPAVSCEAKQARTDVARLARRSSNSEGGRAKAEARRAKAGRFKYAPVAQWTEQAPSNKREIARSNRAGGATSVQNWALQNPPCLRFQRRPACAAVRFSTP